MLKNILELNGTTELTKNQQARVKGSAGTCAYYYYHDPAPYPSPTNPFQLVHESGWLIVKKNLSMAEAQAGAAEHGTHWCCDSCSTASWINSGL